MKLFKPKKNALEKTDKKSDQDLDKFDESLRKFFAIITVAGPLSMGLIGDYSLYRDVKREQIIIKEEIPTKLNNMGNYIRAYADPDSIENKLTDDLHYLANIEGKDTLIKTEVYIPDDYIGDKWDSPAYVVQPIKKIAWEAGMHYFTEGDGINGVIAIWDRTQARKWIQDYYKKDKNRLLNAINESNKRISEYKKRNHKFIPIMTPGAIFISCLGLYIFRKRR